MSSTLPESCLNGILPLSRPWQFTGNRPSQNIIPIILYLFSVLRSQNLGMLRPEKSWRPIVTIKVDDQHKHEIVLGVDGQNPNQREVVHLWVASRAPSSMFLTPCSHHAHHRTQIKLEVYHRSQSKAKSRKQRRLVASAAMALGEVMKRQGTDPCEPPHVLHVLFFKRLTGPVDAELRLSGVFAARKKSIAQKYQPCASLFIRLRPPPSIVRDNDEDDVSSVSSGET